MCVVAKLFGLILEAQGVRNPIPQPLSGYELENDFLRPTKKTEVVEREIYADVLLI